MAIPKLTTNMYSLQITDNHDWKVIEECVLCPADSDLDNVISDLEKIANLKIGELQIDDNPNLLVFPRDLHQHGDEISESYIISTRGSMISTGNIMGFVGVNNTQIDIKSRFAQKDGKDYFLHYMLQKVFSINLFDIKHTTNQEQIFDFLLYLFPHFLKKAFARGLFKKYRRYEHNDANIRGPINISRHIRENIPFRGTVAYTTREHSYDNEITQLVRHTIEYIRTTKFGNGILNNDTETKECVLQIVMATESYKARERQKVINQNLRPIRHPYYSEYTSLQKICLQILRHESLKYGQEKDKIYGILFDGAWLWEEYLNTILKPCGFRHPENKSQKGGLKMFQKDADNETISKNSRKLYPDFWKDDFILDAKYKHLNNGVGREDLYQVVSYMYCTTAKNGAYVYPYEKNEDSISYQLSGYEGIIHVVPVYIPQIEKNFEGFIAGINVSEDTLRNIVKR